MRLTPILTSLLLLISLIIACVDPIDFERAENAQNGFSIQGKLLKGNPSRVDIQINEVFTFTGAPRLVDAKTVEIADDEGNALALNSQEQGIYYLEIPANDDFKVTYGKGYQIRIELNNNEIFESTFDTLYPILPPKEIHVATEKKKIVNNAGAVDSFEVLKFLVDTDFPIYKGKKVNFLWEFESVFKQSDTPGNYFKCNYCEGPNGEKEPKTCYISINPIDNYNVLGTSNLSGNSISNFTLLEQSATSFIFAEGYYLTVLQQSLSDAAYEYWATVKELTTRTGTIFEAPSGKIKTNFYNKSDTPTELFGYFYATESTQERIYIDPTFVKNSNRICPALGNPDGSGPANCCDCLCEPNSTIEKPEWWVE